MPSRLLPRSLHHIPGSCAPPQAPPPQPAWCSRREQQIERCKTCRSFPDASHCPSRYHSQQHAAATFVPVARLQQNSAEACCRKHQLPTYGTNTDSILPASTALTSVGHALGAWAHHTTHTPALITGWWLVGQAQPHTQAGHELPARDLHPPAPCMHRPLRPNHPLPAAISRCPRKHKRRRHSGS